MKYYYFLIISLLILSCRKDNLDKFDFGFTKIIGDNLDDNAQKVILINNELYIFGTKNTTNLYLLKLNLSGEIVLEKEISDNSILNGFDIIQTNDNNLVLLGTIKNSGLNDLIIKKVDLNGNEIWSTIVGGVENELAGGIVETESGEFCIAGTTKSYGAGNNDLYLIWLSQNGEVIREKTYGGTESDGSTALLKSNSDLIILGYTNSWGAGGQDYFLLKVNAVGDSLWGKTYGGSGYEESQGFVESNTGGYIINGHSNSTDPNHDMFTVGVTSSGDLLWEKNFGGNLHDGGQAILKNSDNNYVLIGRSRSFGNGERNVYMVTVSESGNVVEEKSILTESDDWIDSIIEHKNYYYLVGHTKKPNQSDTDLLLMRLKK